MPSVKAAARALAIIVGTAPAAVAETNLYRDLDWHTLQAAQSAVQSVLEEQPSGQSFRWSVPRVAEGSVTPLRTWRSASGHWCREYVERLQLTDGRRYTARGTRCRSDDGRWLIPEG